MIIILAFIQLQGTRPRVPWWQVK